MRHYHLSYWFLACLFVFSCKQDEDNPTPSLTAGPSSITLDAAAGNAVFNIVSNQSWTVSTDQSWITLSTASGANDAIVTVLVTENTGAARTGNITVNSGGLKAVIKVQQSFGLQATASATLDPLGYLKGNFTLSVDARVNWKLSIQDTSWLRCVSPASGNPGTYTLHFFNKLNYGTGSRSNTIRFLSGGDQEMLALPVLQLNSTQANLLLDKKWKVYREIKTHLTTGAVQDYVITNPCETDDWVVLKEDSVTMYQGPVQCTNPRGDSTYKMEYNSTFTTVSLKNNGITDAYSILKLTADSLIIENIPPYMESHKARRIMVKKP